MSTSYLRGEIFEDGGEECRSIGADAFGGEEPSDSARAFSGDSARAFNTVVLPPAILHDPDPLLMNRVRSIEIQGVQETMKRNGRR